MKKRNCRLCSSRYDRYIFSLLLALEILMSFTFLGYIHIPPISITYAFIPILAAGVLLGPAPATVVGAVFGLCSMYKASAFYVMEGDRIFSPFISGTPAESFLLSVGTRVLFGLMAGLLLCWAKRRRHPGFWLGAVAVCSRCLHASLVYAAMGLFFSAQDLELMTGLIKLPSASDLLLDMGCLLMVEGAWKFQHSAMAKKLRSYIDLGENTLRQKGRTDMRPRPFFTGLAVVMFCACVASAIYFARRTSYMMLTHGITLDDTVQYDLLHLQTQFLMAVLSLYAIVWLLFMVVYRYLLYREYLGQLDELTGIMGRRMFLAYCDRRFQENAHSEQEDCFLFVDVDHFKRINDTLGHPTGDQVLRTVAERLQMCFAGVGQVGRMGGDEFAVFVDRAIPAAELRKLLDGFLAGLAGVLPAYGPVTCSIGACYYAYPADLDAVYAETDKLLYAAKQRGRAQYVIGGSAACGCRF